MPITRLKEVLEKNNINYVSILHGKAYTAQELAHTMHIPGKEFIKSVVTVDNNGKNYLVALPADYRLNLNKLAKTLNVENGISPGRKNRNDVSQYRIRSYAAIWNPI